MKRIIILFIIISLCFSYSVQAGSISGGAIAIVDAAEELQNKYVDLVNISVSQCISKENSAEVEIDSSYFYRSIKEKRALSELTESAKTEVFSNMGENEFLAVIVLKSIDSENPYPEIEPIRIKFYVTGTIGGSERRELLGEDYRLYYLDGEQLIEAKTIASDDESVKFEADKLGYYVFYYNPNVYDVEFYEEYPVNDEEAFYVDENLKRYDKVDFPEIPVKDGYVFTGWKQDNMKGRYPTYFYINENNMKALHLWEVYASWCQEDEYTPLEVIIDSDKITKGKEDGAEIILSLSEGRFDDIIDEDVENDWKIVGSDEVKVASVERIDDATATLTLSGNSSDKYTKSEIQVEFNSELYISHEGFGDNWEVHEIADVQLNEKGVKKAVFISDNSITLEKQKKNGGGGGIEKHTITFETNGGEDVESVRVANGHTLEEPERVLKEGYVFAGWYIDEELTTSYDFESSVTESFTLYAAWEKFAKNEPDVEQIILPVKIIEKFIELLKLIMH